MRAATWSEIGDAADLPATAQFAFGCGELSTIAGIKEAHGTDMFRIRVNYPGTFSATTNGLAAFNTQLFLFSSTGVGIYANDDISSTNGQSTLPAGNPSGPTAAGIYYLAISQYRKAPQSPAGFIFPDSSSTAVVGPTGPGGAQPISSWNSEGSTESAYTINLTGAGFAVTDCTPTPTPTPSSADTPTATSTSTPTRSPTWTPTGTPTPTKTPTLTSTQPSKTPTRTPTWTYAPTWTPAETRTRTNTFTRTPTITPGGPTLTPTSPPTRTIGVAVVATERVLIAQPKRGPIGVQLGPDSLASRYTDGGAGLYIYFSYDNGGAGFGAGFTGRWHVDDEDFTNITSTPLVVLQPGFIDPNPAGSFDRTYAGGGTVIECPSDTTKLLYFYHGENQIDDSGYSHLSDGQGWSGLGIALWDENEQRFIKDDQIVGLNISNEWSGTGPPATNLQQPGTAGEASVVYNPSDGYFYIFFNDQTDDAEWGVEGVPHAVFVVAARALASTVCTNVGTATRTTWKKYYHGAWTQDAVLDGGTGGLFTPLVDPRLYGAGGYPNNLNVWLSASGIWVMAATIPSDHYASAGGISMYTSDDGINWAGPMNVIPPATPGTMATPGVTPLPAYPSLYTADDGKIGMTFTRYNATHNWDWTELHALEMELQATLTPTPTFPTFTPTLTPTMRPYAPQANYCANESSGAVLIDESVGTLNGTLDTGVMWGPGHRGTAVLFPTPGVSETGVRLPNDGFDSLTEGTVMMWIKIKEVLNTEQDIFAVDQIPNCNTDSAMALAVFGSDAGKAQIAVYAYRDGSQPLIASYDLDDPLEWHHIAYASDEAGNALFIDGVRVAPDYAAGSPATRLFFADVASRTTTYTLGDYLGCGQSYSFDGAIDEVRIFDVALTEAEVQAAMNDVNCAEPTATSTPTSSTPTSSPAGKNEEALFSTPPSASTATATRTQTRMPSATTETPMPTATPSHSLNRLVPTVPMTVALPTCESGPVIGCRGPASLPAGVLDLKDRSSDEDDRLAWRWTRGGETSREELGDPISGDTYFQLCVFDANGNTIARVSAPPGGECGGRPCWRETASQLVYQSRDLPGGHSSVELKLKPGTDGRARINVQARGSLLGLEPLPAGQPMIAQLEMSDGTCWEAIYDAPAAINDAGRFRYRAE